MTFSLKRNLTEREKIKITATDIKIALSQRHKDDFYMTEVRNGATWTGHEVKILDAVAIRKSWTKPCITGYEIKVSRNDFLNDDKWTSYLPYCHRFNFACPKGLIQPEELPKDVGLVWYNPEKKTLYTKRKSHFKSIEISRDMLYYIIMNKMDSDRIPFYSDKKEYAKNYLDNKRKDINLGYHLGSKLATEIVGLKREKEEWQDEKEKTEIIIYMYSRIKDTLESCGMTLPYFFRWYTDDESFHQQQKDEMNNFCDKLLSRLNGNFDSDAQEVINRLYTDISELHKKYG